MGPSPGMLEKKGPRTAFGWGRGRGDGAGLALTSGGPSRREPAVPGRGGRCPARRAGQSLLFALRSTLDTGEASFLLPHLPRSTKHLTRVPFPKKV